MRFVAILFLTFMTASSARASGVGCTRMTGLQDITLTDITAAGCPFGSVKIKIPIIEPAGNNRFFFREKCAPLDACPAGSVICQENLDTNFCSGGTPCASKATSVFYKYRCGVPPS